MNTLATRLRERLRPHMHVHYAEREELDKVLEKILNDLDERLLALELAAAEGKS